MAARGDWKSTSNVPPASTFSDFKGIVFSNQEDRIESAGFVLFDRLGSA